MKPGNDLGVVGLPLFAGVAVTVITGMIISLTPGQTAPRSARSPARRLPMPGFSPRETPSGEGAQPPRCSLSSPLLTTFSRATRWAGRDCRRRRSSRSSRPTRARSRRSYPWSVSRSAQSLTTLRGRRARLWRGIIRGSRSGEKDRTPALADSSKTTAERLRRGFTSTGVLDGRCRPAASSYSRICPPDRQVFLP
jgi:hypothetical protein